MAQEAWDRFPKHIDDPPPTVKLREMHVVDPCCRSHPHARGATVNVEYPHRVGTLTDRYCGSSFATSVLHESHRAHLYETASATRVGEHIALGQLRMERTLHACPIGGIPPIDVIQRSRAMPAESAAD